MQSSAKAHAFLVDGMAASKAGVSSQHAGDDCGTPAAPPRHSFIHDAAQAFHSTILNSLGLENKQMQGAGPWGSESCFIISTGGSCVACRLQVNLKVHAYT